MTQQVKPLPVAPAPHRITNFCLSCCTCFVFIWKADSQREEDTVLPPVGSLPIWSQWLELSQYETGSQEPVTSLPCVHRGLRFDPSCAAFPGHKVGHGSASRLQLLPIWDAGTNRGRIILLSHHASPKLLHFYSTSLVMSLRKQWDAAQVLGHLTTLEIWIKFLAPRFRLALP